MARIQNLKAINALRALQGGGRVAQTLGVGME